MVLGALVLAALAPSLLWAQEAAKQKSNDGKIHDARSAAPPGIANNATVMDWPATPGTPYAHMMVPVGGGSAAPHR